MKDAKDSPQVRRARQEFVFESERHIPEKGITMGFFDSSRMLKYDFSRGRSEARARTRAEFLAAAGVGFKLVDNDTPAELSDDQLEMLSAAGDLQALMEDTDK